MTEERCRHGNEGPCGVCFGIYPEDPRDTELFALREEVAQLRALKGAIPREVQQTIYRALDLAGATNRTPYAERTYIGCYPIYDVQKWLDTLPVACETGIVESAEVSELKARIKALEAKLSPSPQVPTIYHLTVPMAGSDPWGWSSAVCGSPSPCLITEETFRYYQDSTFAKTCPACEKHLSLETP